ncbi:MAG: hypothetical protein KGJ66_11775 [Alphaproteobacteria bacterium]|nr:hypothetical protein [Alphaproteobacteria bacterium]
MEPAAGHLSTFSSKIAAGYAFALYDDATRKNLEIVRDIRNAFAHSKKLIEFDNELVMVRLGEIVLPAAKHSWRYKNLSSALNEKLGPRFSYIILCTTLTRQFIQRTTRGHTAASRNVRRAMVKKYGPAILDVLEMVLNREKGLKADVVQTSPHHQSADPTTQVPQQTLSAPHSRTGAHGDRNEGNKK